MLHPTRSLTNVFSTSRIYLAKKYGNLPCKTQSFKTVAEKYSSSDASKILFTKEKDIYSGHTENVKEITIHQLCATAATKKKDVATKSLLIRRRVTSGRENTSMIMLS